MESVHLTLKKVITQVVQSVDSTLSHTVFQSIEIIEFYQTQQTNLKGQKGVSQL